MERKSPKYQYISESVVKNLWVFNSCRMPIGIILSYASNCASDTAKALKLSIEEVLEAVSYFDDNPEYKEVETKIMKELENNNEEKRRDRQFDAIMANAIRGKDEYLN